MIKHIFRITALISAGILTLTACALAATPIPAPPSGPNIVGDEGGLLYPPQDLSLVANTGRPQFIHSYADW